MSIWHLAKRELQNFFRSPSAVLFLLVFAWSTAIAFFWVGEFFGNATAEARLLFTSLPYTLAILVGALSMRLWTEEQSTGTIELLRTLPLSTRSLVQGKFLGGLIIITFGLLVTLAIPVLVSQMGNLDWGPVWGGYLAALLMGGMFLAIAMSISASTNNVIVALIGTVAACLAFQLPSAIEPDTFATGGSVWQEVKMQLSHLSVAKRAASVSRGVVDLRDLAYFLGISIFFLFLCVYQLEKKRWSNSLVSKQSKRSLLTALALVFLNVVLLVAWTQPLASARIDLTEDKLFTLSDPTLEMLDSLQQPLQITAFLSKHPTLSAPAFQLVDTLKEYDARSEAVSLKIIDPTLSDDLRRLSTDSGIHPLPLPSKTSAGTGPREAFFGLVIETGDQSTVLSWADLISYKVLGVGDVELRLNNAEKQITRGILHATSSFNTMGSYLTSVIGDASLTFYQSPEMKDGPAAEAAAAAMLSLKSQHPNLATTTVHPKDEEELKEIIKKGIEPYTVVRDGKLQAMYFHLLLTVDGNRSLVPLPESANQKEIEAAVEAAFANTARGFLPVIALATPKLLPQGDPRLPPQMRPPAQKRQSFQALKQYLTKDYQVEDADLTKGVRMGTSVLIVAGPEELTAQEIESIDQYLMTGGTVVILTSSFRANTEALQQMAVVSEPVQSGLSDWLRQKGVSIEPKLILHDERVAATYITRDTGEAKVNFPAFLSLESELKTNTTTMSLDRVTFYWASPISLLDKPGVTHEILVKSPAKSWASSSGKLPPLTAGQPTRPSTPNLEVGDWPIASKTSGTFTSSVAPEMGDQSRNLLQTSPEDSHVIVIGSSSFLSDQAYFLSRELDQASEFKNVRFEENIQFIDAILQLSTGNSSILQIPNRSASKRHLKTDPKNHLKWKLAALLFMFLVVLTIAVIGSKWRTSYLKGFSPPKEKEAS